MNAIPAWTLFDPLAPEAELLDLEDIAAGLSRTFRFHGQTTMTVAQHSVLVARIVPREHAVAGLLHDASEAYLSDLPTPIKHASGFTAYRRLEDRYLRQLAERYSFAYPLHPSIKAADRRVLRAECEALLPAAMLPQVAPRVRAADVEIVPTWTPAQARKRFLAEARLLGLRE